MDEEYELHPITLPCGRPSKIVCAAMAQLTNFLIGYRLLSLIG